MTKVRAVLRENFAKLDRIVLGGNLSPNDYHYDQAKRVVSHGVARADEPTVQKQCAVASRFLNDACRREIILRNPFESVPKANLTTKHRAFICDSDAQKVLAELPDAQWKLLFALARWGGLRVGSEVRQLAWADVDWSNQRILIRSPKTERYEGRASRSIPMFPELAPLLAARREEAALEETLVLPMLEGKTVAALRKPLQKAIERAGLTIWPKLWVNLRSTRESELAERFPMHVVCQWIGNTKAIAAKHYLQVTDDHYAKATEDLRNQMLRQPPKAAQKAPQHIGIERQAPEAENQLSLDVRVFSNLDVAEIPPRGFEQAQHSSKLCDSASSAAPSAALDPKHDLNDPNLATLIEAWPTLPEAVRADILAMVQAASGAR
jgi:integrase